jgi:hypothetical protein
MSIYDSPEYLNKLSAKTNLFRWCRYGKQPFLARHQPCMLADHFPIQGSGTEHAVAGSTWNLIDI